LKDWDAELLEFTPLEVNQMAEMEHVRWMNEKINDGWKYGPVRNDEKKIHPSLIPWDELPENDKEINRNFVRKLPHILARVDLEIYPLSCT